MKRLVFSTFSLFLALSQTSGAEEPLTLEAFLAQVKAENLGLKVESAKADAASARAVGLNIPPPMAGYIDMKMDDGSSAWLPVIWSRSL